MKIQTFVIGYVLALALFLFAQHRQEMPQPGGFREVVDLTHSIPTPSPTPADKSVLALEDMVVGGQNRPMLTGLSSAQQFATLMDAPARLVRGMWTVDQIPAGRLIAPLVVLDTSPNVKSNPDYEISVQDIARWEQTNGQMPLGAVVMVRTGWESRWNSARSYRNTDAPAVIYSAVGNQFLRPERTSEIEAGFDIRFLRRANAEFTFYSKNTQGLRRILP